MQSLKIDGVQATAAGALRPVSLALAIGLLSDGENDGAVGRELRERGERERGASTCAWTLR